MARYDPTVSSEACPGCRNFHQKFNRLPSNLTLSSMIASEAESSDRPPHRKRQYKAWVNAWATEGPESYDT